MDFKKLHDKLASPYWNTRPVSDYTLDYNGVRAGPGVWFENSSPSERVIWNIAWASMPFIDQRPITLADAALFISNLPLLRKFGESPVLLAQPHMAEKFALVELSNLLTLEEFVPHMLAIKRTQAFPLWIRNGMLARLNAKKAAA